MEIKTPAIFLSFDDSWIDIWHESLPFFEEYDIKATFYLSFGVNEGKVNTPYSMTDIRWERLKEIHDSGHTIGFHTVGHERVDTTIRKIGGAQYCQKEIYPGLETMGKHGIIPRHFAYPYGRWSEESNKCLLAVFDTLRGSVIPQEADLMRLYDTRDLSNLRIFTALDILYDFFPEYLNRLTKEKKIGFFHAHRTAPWIQGKLRAIFKMGQAHGINFYPMSMLDRSSIIHEK